MTFVEERLHGLFWGARVDGLFDVYSDNYRGRREVERILHHCFRLVDSLLNIETTCTSYYFGVLSCLNRLIGFFYSCPEFMMHHVQEIDHLGRISSEWYKVEMLHYAAREFIMKLLALMIDFAPGHAFRCCEYMWNRFAPSDLRFCLELAELLIDKSIGIGNLDFLRWLEKDDIFPHTSSFCDSALLLKVLFAAGRHDIIPYVCDSVIRHLKEKPILDYSGFTNLLKTGIKIGQFEWVHYLLESIGEEFIYNIGKMHRYSPEFKHIPERVPMELWSIAERVGADDFLSALNDFVLSNDGWNSVLDMTDMQIANMGNSQILDYFFRQFDEAFSFDAKKSVRVLLRVAVSEGYQNQYKAIIRAAQWALKHFQSLVLQSVPTAIDLLLWRGAREMGGYVACVRMCFDYALGEFDTNYSDQLCRLVDGLETDFSGELREYFAARMTYIRIYSQTLADSIVWKMGIWFD